MPLHDSTMAVDHDQQNKILQPPVGLYWAASPTYTRLIVPSCLLPDPIDRLTALWQYCYPTAWIPSDPTHQHIDGTFTIKSESFVDASTDLTPFRHSPSAYVTSDDVRTVDVDCGYSYPEIVRARKEQWPPSRMLHYMLRLYTPSQHFIHRWFLVLERICKGAFNGPYSMRIFLDLPSADSSTPTSSPHYAGAVFVFARDQAGSTSGGRIRCANCELRPFMRASLELTKAMLRLGITTAPEISGDGGRLQAPKRNPLGGEGAVKLVYMNQKGEQLPEPPILPKVMVVYEEGVPDEQIFEFLLNTANSSKEQPISDVLCQNHALPKGPVCAFQCAITKFPSNL
eukprot:c21630_g3_i1 orf=433-1458(-)